MRNPTTFLPGVIFCLLSAGRPHVTWAQSNFSGWNSPAGDAASLPLPGTRINMQNWRQYRNYMSDGVQSLFEGKYFWKMPADVEINIGSTVINPPPKNYLAATERYAGQVKLQRLPNGGLTMKNYRGGAPFPNPSDPEMGWKILADTYFRYMPHLTVITHGGSCSTDSNRDVNCSSGDLVYRQMSFNTDPGVPYTEAGFENESWTQWYDINEPEQYRYLSVLTIAYNDLQRPEDIYGFIPSLRRYQRFSSLGRCNTPGVDYTPDDYRSGFDANLTEMKVDYQGERKILVLILPEMPGKYPDYFDMPLGWPKPSWGNWQLRDVYTVSASKLPQYAPSYCYGKRTMYIDKTTFATYWEELYDVAMKPWKIVGLFLHTIDVPGIGPVDESNSLIYAFWDIQNKHASYLLDPIDKRNPVYVNEQVPKEYRDVRRYSTPAGLNLIMR